MIQDQVKKSLVSNNDVDNNFCYSKYINCSLYQLEIDYFCQPINNDKDEILEITLLIGEYRQYGHKVY